MFLTSWGDNVGPKSLHIWASVSVFSGRALFPSRAKISIAVTLPCRHRSIKSLGDRRPMALWME